MRGAALALLTAGLFLGGILVGVGLDDEPAVPAPEVVRLVDAAGPAPTPTSSPAPSPAPTTSVERVEREVDYGDIEDYGDQDRRGRDGREDGHEDDHEDDRDRDDDRERDKDRERDDEERSGENGEDDEPEREKDD